MTSKTQQTPRRGAAELIRSYKAKREARKKDEAARNRRTADQHWEVLNMTWGSAKRPEYFVSEYHPGRAGVSGTAQKPSASGGNK
jgi:hypothetical protein